MGVWTVIGMGAIGFGVTFFLQMVWGSGFERIRVQRMYEDIERLANRDIETVRTMPKVSVEEKRRLMERILHLKWNAKVRYDGRERKRLTNSVVEGRYFLNPNAYLTDLTEMTCLGVFGMMLAVGYGIFAPWEDGHPFSTTMGVSFVLSILNGYILSRDSRATTDSAESSYRHFLTAKDVLLIQWFLDQMEEYRTKDDQYKIYIDEKDGRHYRIVQVPALRETLLEEEMEEISPWAIRLLDLADVLREMREVVVRLQKDPLYHTTKAPTFHVFFEMLHQKQRYPKDALHLLSTSSLWSEHEQDMEEALALFRRLHEILSVWSQFSQGEVQTVASVAPAVVAPVIERGDAARAANFEEKRVSYALEMVEKIRNREDVDPEVKRMADEVKRGVDQARMDLERQREEQRLRWEEMQDFSTIKSVRDALGMNPEEEKEWMEKR